MLVLNFDCPLYQINDFTLHPRDGKYTGKLIANAFRLIITLNAK